MRMPSASGAQFYRVTKDFSVGGHSGWAHEGQLVQVNHIMAVTGDARSAILQQSLSQGAVGCAITSAIFGTVFGCCFGLMPLLIVSSTMIPMMANVDDTRESSSIWGCAEMWMVVAPILIGCPLCCIRRACSAARASP
jgi:hypothetical protein